MASFGLPPLERLEHEGLRSVLAGELYQLRGQLARGIETQAGDAPVEVSTEAPAATQTGTAQHLAVEAFTPRAEASGLQLSALKGSDCDVWSCKCCAAACQASLRLLLFDALTQGVSLTVVLRR